MWAISIDGEQIRDDLLFVLRDNPDFHPREVRRYDKINTCRNFRKLRRP